MNTDIARERLARVPAVIRERMLEARGDLPAGAVTCVARFFDTLVARGEHLSAATKGAFVQACPSESSLGLLLRVLTKYAPEVCLSAGRELRKEMYRRRPGGSDDQQRASRSDRCDRLNPRNWPDEWLRLLPGLQDAPVSESTINRHIASVNRCADLVGRLSFRPRLGWLLARELGRMLHEGTEGIEVVNPRTVANYLGGLVSLGLHGGLDEVALIGLRLEQQKYQRQGRRLSKKKEGRLNEIYEAGGYEEILRVIVAKLEGADQLPDWSAAASEARATAAILAVCVNVPARTGDVCQWRFGQELQRTIWGTWELRWRQEKTRSWVALGELWPEVSKVLDEHILGGRPERLAQVRFEELKGKNWLSFDDQPYARGWPSQRVKNAISVPLHDLRTLCADYLRLYDPVRAPGIVATMLGHRTEIAGREYAALCVETAAQKEWGDIRQAHLAPTAKRRRSSIAYASF